MITIPDKIMSMKEAIKKLVHDESFVFFGGFGNGMSFSAAHEIIRQNLRNLKVTKCGGGIMFDQLIGAGVTNQIVTSHCWNGTGPQPAYNLRRAMEEGIPQKIIYNEQSLFMINMSFFAGYMGIPFVPIRSVVGTGIYDHPKEVGLKAARVKCPFTGEEICVVPAINPDVGFIQVQRADSEGNAQLWGLIGDTKYGINACEKIIVAAEEIVDKKVIMESPERTIVGAHKVDAVILEPWGAHPSSMQGFYYTDLEYRFNYAKETKTIEDWEHWLEKWVTGIENRQEYLKVLGEDKMKFLNAKPIIQGAVNYGY
ncbi:MAG: CoA transferase subunit A [Promethearchaeota archaeon]